MDSGRKGTENMNILELIDELMNEGFTEEEAELYASVYYQIYETEED